MSESERLTPQSFLPLTPVVFQILLALTDHERHGYGIMKEVGDRTAGAVIIGFRVRPQVAARQEAEREEVDIHVYDVIYEAVDEITAALEGMLAPEKRETILGTAEVREVFKVSKVGTIAGCHVAEGRVERTGHARLIRDGIVVYDGDVSSLKRFKDDVKEVREGFECGIGIANFNDIKVGDVIECFTFEEFARTLASST